MDHCIEEVERGGRASNEGVFPLIIHDGQRRIVSLEQGATKGLLPHSVSVVRGNFMREFESKSSSLLYKMYLSRIQAKQMRKARTNLISHQPSNVSLMKDIACIHSDTPSKSPSPLSVYARADSQAFDIFPLSLPRLLVRLECPLSLDLLPRPPLCLMFASFASCDAYGYMGGVPGSS